MSETTAQEEEISEDDIVADQLYDLAAQEDRSQGRVWIQVTTGPETIRVLSKIIDNGEIPDTYVSAGRVVHVERVSGGEGQGDIDADSPLPVRTFTLDSTRLSALLAEHTWTYQRKKASGGGEMYSQECTPKGDVLAAALARSSWPNLRPLFGLLGSPVLRQDGTLLQDAGYDEVTGYYLAKKVPLEHVPEEPTAGQVTAAREFLFDRFLGDFPWVSRADKANYVAMLITPILQPFTRSLAPFGLIDATMPGSGKTILTAAIGMLYGQTVQSWMDKDEELRKTITAVMAEAVGCVVFDNLQEGSVINSPILARLITERTWSDRKLGTNNTLSYRNDRLWMATGNNLSVGGDMASRTILVRLNPNTPRPELRTGFTIPNLDEWILHPAHQREVLWNLLILVVDWCRAGAPRNTDHTMRQFTNWAQHAGGFLAHHGLSGFLANVEDVRSIDEDDAEWTAFLARWFYLHGARQLTAAQLVETAQPPAPAYPGAPIEDRWEGTFIATDRAGRPVPPKSLGNRLRGHVGRFHGNFKLRKDVDRHNSMSVWSVEQFEFSDGTPKQIPQIPQIPQSAGQST